MARRLNGRPGGRERLAGGEDRCRRLGRGRSEAVVRLHGDAQAAEIGVARVWQGDVSDAAVLPVRSGDDPQQQGDVLHRAGKRADLGAWIAECADLASVVEYTG